MPNRSTGTVLGVILLLLPTLNAQSALQAQWAWTISPLDSFANFTVKHLMVSNVHGSIGGMNGAVVYLPNDPSKDMVDVTLDVKTFSTGTARRDLQVKTDYFDVKNYPVIRFKSTRVFKAGPGRLRMTGNLTIKNITKQVVLEVEGPSQPVKDAQGRQKIGLTATAKISRKDFGIVGTALDGAVETGGIVVSDEVNIELDIELTPSPVR
jgi:polyisoprenoid-binding protein YceI